MMLQGTKVSWSAVLAVLLAMLSEAGAFYLPGVAPRKYRTGERMRVKVNTLTSDLTPLQVTIDTCTPHSQPDGMTLHLDI